nr:unnamed protein product [Haemonchus contortus]
MKPADCRLLSHFTSFARTPSCLTFTDSMKAFDVVVKEAAADALGNRDLSTQYARMPREFYTLQDQDFAILQG